MKSRHLNWLVVLSLVPLLWELPYVFRAMSTSPLEARNHYFILLAIAQAAFALYIGHKHDTLKFSEKPNVAFLSFVLISLACLAVSWHKNVHFAMLLSSTCLFWSSSCTIFNWPTACSLLPSCAMFMLGVPSTGFLLSNATGMSGLAAKTIFAVLLLLLTPLASSNCRPSPNKLLYFCACLALVASYGMKLTTGRMAPALLLHCSTMSAADFNGTNMEITEADRSYYGQSDIQRYLFLDATGTAIHVLDVSKVADIHSIHPMAYCLRASGLTLESEQTVAIKADGRVAYIHEIITSGNGRRYIHWQWYSTPENSTANFLLFRSAYSKADDWRMIQLTTDLTDTPADSRLRLMRFTEAFLSTAK